MKRVIVFVLLLIILIQISIITFNHFQVKEYDEVLSFCSQEPCEELAFQKYLIRINWAEFEELPLQKEFLYKPNISIEMSEWGLGKIPSVANLNSEGLRSPQINIKKKEGEKRVVLLGDSMVFGVKVNDSDNFASLIDNHSSELQIINMAIPGFSTKVMVDSYFEKGHKYNPDLIVMFYFLNDVEHFEAIQNIVGITEDFNLTREEKHTFLSEIIFPSYWDYLLIDFDGMFEKRVFNQYERLVETDIPVIFVLFPGSHKQVFDEMKMKNYTYYDLSEIGYEYKGKWIVHPDDSHLSIYGHERIAEYLYPIIMEILE